MNQSGLSSPAALIHNLPWRIRESLHTKLQLHWPPPEIARWLFRQTRQSDVRNYGAALAAYVASDAYRHGLEQERRSVAVTTLIATGPKPRRGNRLALSLVLDRLSAAAVNTATENGW